MRIGVDVMGGDHAPDAILQGSLDAVGRLADVGDGRSELVLVGDEGVIQSGIEKSGVDAGSITIVGTTEVIAMDEPPVEAVRAKPDSSLTMLARMAGRKVSDPLDVIISAGNTGALVTAAQMYMRRLPNVHRPGIAVTLPTFGGPVILIDVGANIEPKPHHLAQYGVMGEILARKMLGIEKPRIGLMNVGGEEQKGTDDLKKARELLASEPTTEFVGNIEGRAVFEGIADVVITDGVVGNVVLKLAEGLSAGIFKAIGREIKKCDPELALRFKPIVTHLYAEHDYHEYGGAPLVGVNGGCLIAHGSSEARTICNAILAAHKLVESGVNRAIVQRLGAMKEEVA
jgi:glycerol-3-phosphate acyltransferase PlsX